MVPGTQVKLLRVLQERTFRPLGSSREQSVDIRIIAATNANVTEAVRVGKLREDLYYRLNVFAIALPPLRNRMDDLPLLADAFIREFNARNHRSVAGVEPVAMARLMQHRWPGNVRELRNVIERATIVAAGHFIQPGDLPPLEAGSLRPPPGPLESESATLTPGTTVDEAERRLIEITLEHTKHNKTRAAEMLGISLKTLHNKLNRFASEPRGKDQ